MVKKRLPPEVNLPLTLVAA